MNKRLFLAVAAAAAMLGSYAQITSPASDGYVRRAAAMYADGNYNGCIDQLTKVDEASLTEGDVALSRYYQAAATVHIDKARAARLLARFLADFPSSELRPLAQLAYGDCYYGTDYARALSIYQAINANALGGENANDLAFRQAYSCLKLERYDDALALFGKLERTSTYGAAARFYKGYIAYSKGDFGSAEKIFSSVDQSTPPGNMADFYLSQIYYRGGQYNKALSMAKNILARQEIGPSFIAEANRLAGESSYELGQDPQAVKYLETYVSMTESPMPSALYILGLDAYNKGLYGKTIDYMQPVAYMTDAMGQSAYLYIGQAYMHQGDYTSAAMAFNRALNMDYDKAVQETAYYNYAVASMQGGKVPFASTVTIFSDFLRLYPNSKYAADVQEYIINSYLIDKNYAEALKSINEMKNPSEATLAAKQRVLYSLGNQCLSSGKYSQALEYLTQAASMQGYDKTIDREVALTLGEAYYRNGQYAKAESEINKYLKAASATSVNRAIAYYDMGYALYAQKKYTQAAANFENMLKAPGTLSSNIVADAYNRLGDCLYYNKKFDQAEDAYDKAYDSNPSAGDYALYQKALMAGYQRQYERKIAMLQQIEDRFPSSALIPDALLETTESYIQMGKNDKAIETYRTLVKKYPNTDQGRQGYLQMALTLLNSGRHDEAVEAYKEVIRRYPSSDEARQAIEQMKRVAAEDGNLREFMAFVNSTTGAPKMDESEIEQITFETAEKGYLTQNKLDQLEDFVDDYPDSNLRPRALAYLVEGEMAAGDYDAAYDYANALVSQYPDNSLVQQALAAKATIEEHNGKGGQALDSWKRLEKKASTPELLLQARMGIIRNGREAGDYDEVLRASDAVLASSGVGSDDLLEARYSRALVLYRNGDVASARKEWESIATDTRNLYGLQGAYYLGESYFNSKDYKTAERWAQAVANADTQYQYWQARGFILLSDVYAAQGDTFKARQYLEALRDYYTGTEEDIKNMLDQRLR